MCTAYDNGFESLQKLILFHSENVAARNEATTRSQLIDTLLYECLSWEKRDVIPEIAHDGTYADYTFFAPRPLLILEAKREGEYFTVPAGKNHLTYSLESICRGNSQLRAAIDQVADYCHDRGIQLGAASNGHQLVCFIANRSDGIPYMDGRALVFPSLAFMSDHFLELWNAISRPGLEEKHLHKKLFGAVEAELPPPLSSRLDVYPGSKNRNPFQADLKILSEIVIEDIAKAKELEIKFLEECYCQVGLLSRHSLATKTFLAARYAALFSETSPGPVTQPAVHKQEYSPG